MREKYLDLKKTVVIMNDQYEFLNMSEREELKNYENEMKVLEEKLSDEDKKWIDEEFGKWYDQYIMMETLIFIKPRAG